MSQCFATVCIIPVPDQSKEPPMLACIQRFCAKDRTYNTHQCLYAQCNLCCFVLLLLVLLLLIIHTFHFFIAATRAPVSVLLRSAKTKQKILAPRQAVLTSLLFKLSIYVKERCS